MKYNKIKASETHFSEVGVRTDIELEKLIKFIN